MKDQGVKNGRKTAEGKSAPGRDASIRGKITRAQRYEIDTMLRYRIRGEKEWREGVMKNISISGVLLTQITPFPGYGH